jgi:hypothetical protein
MKASRKAMETCLESMDVIWERCGGGGQWTKIGGQHGG